MDSKAITHMTSSKENPDSTVPYHYTNKVTFTNGIILPISHVGTFSINSHLKLQDVQIVPYLKKNLLSVSVTSLIFSNRKKNFALCLQNHDIFVCRKSQFIKTF